MASTISIDWTLVIAVYAAVVATATILWDFYKWKTAGPNLSAVLSTDMRGYNLPEYAGKTLMLLNVTNRGDRPTTITHLTMHQYKSWWAYLRERPTLSFVVMQPNTVERVPHVLPPGGVWAGIAEQTEDVERMAAEGHLYIGLTHSHAKKRIRRLVTIRARTD